MPEDMYDSDSRLAPGPASSDSFADSCELCSRLSALSSEPGHATDSADPAPTAVLDVEHSDVDDESGYTEALPTGMIPRASEHIGPDSGSDSKVFSLQALSMRAKVLLCCVGALFIALCIGLPLFFSLGGFDLFSSVDAAVVERTLSSNNEFMQGFTGDDYVTPSEYTLSDVEIIDSYGGDDGTVSAQVSATLSNDSFISSCHLSMQFVRVRDVASAEGFSDTPVPQGAADSDWVGRIVDIDVATRAIKGVDHDPEFPSEFSPKFDERSQSCTFTIEDATALWFADVAVTSTYTYSFDGSSWIRSGPVEGETTSYKELEGTYSASSGDSSEFASFSISGLDSAKGTFTLTYDKRASLFSSDAISGSLECRIVPVATSSAYDGCRQENGLVYTFEGTGTSSGGDGEARISGAFTQDGGLMFKFQGDYTENLLFGGSRSSSTIETGKFSK